MPRNLYTNAQITEAIREIGCWSPSKVGQLMGAGKSNMSERLNRIWDRTINDHPDYKRFKPLLSLPWLDNNSRPIYKNKDFKVEAPPAAELPIEELLDQRCSLFECKKAHETARKQIQITMYEGRPIALFVLGDPHVDDDGCDWPTLLKHIDLINSTDGMYVCNIGDTTNNWIGRLTRLYAEQTTSAHQALQLAKHLIESLKDKWLINLAGNHDGWSGAGDPLQWMYEKVNALYIDSDARFRINFANKKHTKVNCHFAHNLKGHSMYHSLQGLIKEKYFGFRDQIMVCGHTHVSDYMNTLSPEEDMTIHLSQVSTYKVYDRFQREGSFKNKHISSCSVFVIDPEGDPILNQIQHFHDPFRAAEYLAFLRSKK